MKDTAEKLASMRFTLLILIVLALWFMWGLSLTGFDRFTRGFELMNSMVMKKWLFSDHEGSALLKFWFVGLCIVMAVLGINLILCTWQKIFRVIRVRFDGPRFYMLIVHVFFGLVALAHLGGLMLGFKHQNIRLYKGDEVSLSEGYGIRVEDVNFVDDLSVLSKSKRELLGSEFHYRDNYAGVLLSYKGKPVQRGKVGTMDPLKYRDVQVTLTKFVPGPRSRGGKGGRPEPGVVLTLSKNPVLSFFLIVYPMMIAGIFVYLFITWKSPSRNERSPG